MQPVEVTNVGIIDFRGELDLYCYDTTIWILDDQIYFVISGVCPQMTYLVTERWDIATNAQCDESLEERSEEGAILQAPIVAVSVCTRSISEKRLRSRAEEPCCKSRICELMFRLVSQSIQFSAFGCPSGNFVQQPQLGEGFPEIPYGRATWATLL